MSDETSGLHSPLPTLRCHRLHCPWNKFGSSPLSIVRELFWHFGQYGSVHPSGKRKSIKSNWLTSCQSPMCDPSSRHPMVHPIQVRHRGHPHPADLWDSQVVKGTFLKPNMASSLMQSLWGWGLTKNKTCPTHFTRCVPLNHLTRSR